MTRLLQAALLLAAAAAAADVPDLTADMEPLCNPNATRWTASQPMARAATSIGVCDGRLFVSGGDWDANLGPCPIFAVDPTRAFKGRVLYIAGIPEMTTVPFALYTATNANHGVRATRVNLGSGVFPFDIFVHDDVSTVLAAQYDDTSKKAVNSVWESADGVTFEKKFTFSGVQYANAIAYCDGAYFVAMGAREAVKNAWTFAGTDEVGMIYRIRDPAFAGAIQVVAESAAVSIAEGGTAVARFRLAAQPASAVTAAVRVSGGVPAVSADVASVTFTPEDWGAWHEVPLSVAGPLAFDVPTENRSSLFVSIVASTVPFLQGDLLPAP